MHARSARTNPTSIFGLGPRLGSFVFGFEMGTGVRTYLPSSAAHVLLAGLLLVGVDAGTFAIAAVGFGAGRAAMPVFRYLSGEVDHVWDERLVRRLDLLVPLATVGVAALVISRVVRLLGWIEF